MRVITAIGAIVFAAAITGGVPAFAEDYDWDTIDAACVSGLGAGCYAVADTDGSPKMTDGKYVCTCSAAFKAPKPLNLAQRLDLARKIGPKGVRVLKTNLKDMKKEKTK